MPSRVFLYPVATWNEVKNKNSKAHFMFLQVVKEWMRVPALNMVFKLLSKAANTPQDVLELFHVRAKRNWNSIVVYPSDALLGLVVASGCQRYISTGYYWSRPKPWWSIHAPC